MSVLEIPRGESTVNGRRESESLSQCLLCGTLVWSHAADDEAECRCSLARVMHDVAEAPELAGSAA